MLILVLAYHSYYINGGIMEEKKALNINLGAKDIYKTRDIVDLLAKWYRERVLEYPNTDTVEQTRVLLEQWGRVS